ncbi:MAG: TonB-dependent receptor domain-containing protein [Emticicia sp.]|uniref:TonB-dependent receptor domain-containing protein n=1 Tax=Emticicia sp. TaxID=1930953 RepID=UPI003BA64E1A
MKKLSSIFTIIIAATTLATAQFGPGGMGGMGGGQRGDGNGRPQNTQQAPAFNLEGNAPKGNSKVFGFVVDESVSTAVEFANVAIYTKDTKKVIDGTIADEKGKFSMNRVAAGEYNLVITFIGFKDKTIEIKVEKGKDIDLGVIKLAQSVKQLEEVTVTAEKSMIEEKVDRLVYNAEKDLTSKGGDAADILRKVPMLSVDLDGNVSLRGTSNLRVLINNKPSTIVASSIADALKMIPADLIKTVEVITSPSAKYDAEGSGGIINIILKKSTLQGLTLNIDSGVGIRGSNLSLNGNYRQGKLGVTLGGFGRLFYNKSLVTLDQTTVQNGVSTLTNQNVNAFDNGLFGRYNLGFDYDLAKNQSLTASVAFGTRNFSRDQDFTINQFKNNVALPSTYRSVDARDLSNSVDINLDYIRTFKPSQELSVSGQFSQNKLTNNFFTDFLSDSQQLVSRQQNLNNNFNNEITLQTDFQTPIKQNQQFEVGLKTVIRQVDSDFEYLVANPTGSFSSDARNPAGLLNYSQSIAAGYVSYTYSTKNKYTFKVGTRYEYTTIEANDQKSDIVIPAYGNLVPSVNISKSVGKASTLKLAYNNRIQRPGLQQLNPNLNIANPQSISVGNPTLRPEVSNNVELSLSTNIKKTYLNLSVFGRQTNNSITRISMPSDSVVGAIITTFENIGKEQTFGTNIFGNFFLTPKWTLNGGVDIYYNYLEGQQTGLDGLSSKISNSGFVVSGRMQSSVSLKNGWAIQAFGGFRGNRVQLQGNQGGMGMYSIGARKEFANKKGSLGLAAENFFGMSMRSTLTTPQFNQVMFNKLYNQNVKLTFSYKIGKMKFTQTKQSKVKNDDVKSGGDNNNN